MISPEYHFGSMAMLTYKTYGFFVNVKMMPHMDFKFPSPKSESESETESETEPDEPTPTPKPVVESDSSDTEDDEDIWDEKIKQCVEEENREKWCSEKLVGN